MVLCVRSFLVNRRRFVVRRSPWPTRAVAGQNTEQLTARMAPRESWESHLPQAQRGCGLSPAGGERGALQRSRLGGRTRCTCCRSHGERIARLGVWKDSPTPPDPEVRCVTSAVLYPSYAQNWGHGLWLDAIVV
ncbi:hypothetical protein TRVL_03003 [Trypanosoma vivax]|nr:hypothetical protein TRVL_03003 [Trypanosoma vivax]